MKRYRRKIDKKRRNLYLIIVLLLVCMGAGYASLRDTISVGGNTSIDGNTWSIYLTNVAPTANNNYTPFAAPTITDNTSISFNINLSEPNEIYEFSIQVINNGSLDAKLSEFSITPIEGTLANYIEYTVKYSDGSNINIGDKLLYNTNKTLVVRVRYKVNSYENLLHNDQSLNLGFNLKYVQDI
jgi:hypothetical protein